MRISLVFLLALCAGSAAAEAEEPLIVGLYAPGAPFDGPVARLDYVSRLASHLGEGLPRRLSGRAFARAADFNAAVKRGELQIAVVDAPYLAALGVPYTVLAQATRAGATSGPWELVAAGSASGVLDLKGKVLAVAAVGARDEAFVNEVLLEGELPRSHFARIVYAPDALSALASVENGRADAALVPAGLPLPAGVRRLATLSSVGWPLLVALPGAPADVVLAVAAAAPLFRGGAALEGFVKSDAEATRALAGRFEPRVRRGPFAVPPIKLTVDALVSGRRFAIAPPDVGQYAVDPALP